MSKASYSRMRKVGEPTNGPVLDTKPFFGPTVSFTDKELPAQSDWKPGETYHLEVEVKMTNRSEGRGSYQIQKVGTEENEAEDYEEED